MNRTFRFLHQAVIASIVLASVGCGGADNPAQPTYSLGGTVSGLGSGKSLTLRNNGGNDLTLSANAAFAFSTKLANTAPYAVAVSTQPVGQTCSASNDKGSINGSNVANVMVACVTDSAMEAIKADMTSNEAPLQGVSGTSGWQKAAIMSMGGTPRGDNSPTYWKPADLTYKSADYWSAIAPWFTLHKGVDHKATNVRVKISNITAYILKKSTNTWELVGAKDSDPIWAFYQKFDFGPAIALGNAAARKEPDGKLSYKLTAESSRVHGGSGKFPIIGSDVKAVFIHMTTELILDDSSGVDDRHLAQLLLSAGADYYPNMTTKVADYSPMTYAPNVAASRHGLVSAAPRIHYVATIDPPGQEKNVSPYQKAGGVSAIPVAEFEANPPPGVIAP